MTGHSDHRAVSKWTTLALGRAGVVAPRVLHVALSPEHTAAFADMQADVFLPDQPRPVVPRASAALVLSLEGELLRRKVRALVAHRSQTEPFVRALGPARYAAWVAEELYVSTQLAADQGPMTGRRLS